MVGPIKAVKVNEKRFDIVTKVKIEKFKLLDDKVIKSKEILMKETEEWVAFINKLISMKVK